VEEDKNTEQFENVNNEYVSYYDENKSEENEKEKVNSDDKENLDNENKKNSLGYEIYTWVRDFSIIILVILLFTNFVAERTKVIGDSMEPSIHDGDRIFIDKLSYRFTEPERFDVVVFPYDKNPDLNYIKRIIGLPGEEVDIKGGKIYINGEVLDEHFGKETIKVYGNQDFPIVIPEGEYFVLGDNRNESLDSRYKDVGTIPKEELLGKAGLRIWPLSDFGTIE